MLTLLIMTLITSALSANSTLQIYGVRWMLGNSFAVSPILNQKYVLMFNSDTVPTGNIILSMGKMRVTCSSITFKQPVNTIIHKCYVHSHISQQNVNYSIFHEISAVSGADRAAKVHFVRQILFEGVLRSIGGKQMSMVMIGNWPINNENWNKKLNLQTKRNPNISLIISTGKLLPNINDNNYQKTLKSIEYLTSKLPLLIINGQNDNTMDRQLMSATFYSPQWVQYESYFSLINFQQLGISILTYTPTDVLPQYQHLNINLHQIFEEQLTAETVKWLRKTQFVIALSSLSYKCSWNPQCSQNENNLAYYSDKFRNINMDLYLSSSNSGYQRTQGICWNNTLEQTNEGYYQLNCPIFVNEGQSDLESEEPKWKDFSASHSLSGGIGIITVHAKQNTAQQVIYQHLDQNFTTFDQFTFKRAAQQTTADTEHQILKTKIYYSIIAIEYLGLGAFIAFIVYTLISLVVRNRSVEVQGHVEMVEENNNNQPNQINP